MSIDPAQPPNEPEEEVPFGTSRLPPAAIFGLIAAVLPFVLKFESWSSSEVGGVRTVSYSEPVAMGGGIVAAICGVLLLVGAIRKTPVPPTLMTWGLGVLLLGAGVWHALRGFGILLPAGLG
jgi:hypothetical protein